MEVPRAELREPDLGSQVELALVDMASGNVLYVTGATVRGLSQIKEVGQVEKVKITLEFD